MKNDWLNAIQEIKRTEGIKPRQKGHQTALEIADAIRCRKTAVRNAIVRLRKAGRVEVGAMTVFDKEGKRRHVPTYKLL